MIPWCSFSRLSKIVSKFRATRGWLTNRIPAWRVNSQMLADITSSICIYDNNTRFKARVIAWLSIFFQVMRKNLIKQKNNTRFYWTINLSLWQARRWYVGGIFLSLSLSRQSYSINNKTINDKFSTKLLSTKAIAFLFPGKTREE